MKSEAIAAPAHPSAHSHKRKSPKPSTPRQTPPLTHTHNAKLDDTEGERDEVRDEWCKKR